MSETKKPAVFVGYTATTIAEPEKYLEQPTPPSNYGEEAIAKWKETKGVELWDKALEQAALSKLTGRISRIVAIDPVDGRVWDSDHGAPVPPSSAAVKFLEWLRSRSINPAEVVLFGFDIREFVRVSGVEALLLGQDVPLSYWYQHEDVYDPYAMLVEDARRKFLSLPVVLGMADLKCPDGWAAHTDPKVDATLAYNLTVKLRLLPDCVDSSKFAVTQPKAKKPKVAAAE